MKQLHKVMQAIGRRRIHASISDDTPIKTIAIKQFTAFSFKNFVKSNEFKLFLKTLSDFDCFNVYRVHCTAYKNTAASLSAKRFLQFSCGMVDATLPMSSNSLVNM